MINEVISGIVNALLLWILATLGGVVIFLIWELIRLLFFGGSDESDLG